jgi:hypothetical protein
MYSSDFSRLSNCISTNYLIISKFLGFPLLSSCICTNYLIIFKSEDSPNLRVAAFYIWFSLKVSLFSIVLSTIAVFATILVKYHNPKKIHVLLLQPCINKITYMFIRAKEYQRNVAFSRSLLHL